MTTEEIKKLETINRFMDDFSTCGPAYMDADFERIINYNFLHKVWDKFKRLNFYGEEYCSAYSHRHRHHTFLISSKLINGTKEETFNELFEGTKWYSSLKKDKE